LPRGVSEVILLLASKAAEHVMKKIRKLFLKMAKDITEELKEIEK